VTDARRLHVVFLDSWLSDRASGIGSAVAISGLARGIRSLGHQVTVLRPRIRLPALDLTRVMANLGYPSRVRSLAADLVVGFDLDGCFLADGESSHTVALKGVAADELRYESGWNRIRFQLLSRLERRNARRAYRVVVTSEHSRRVALRAYGLDPATVRIVPEGIDPEVWEDFEAERRSDDPHPTVISVARQYRRKNTATLVRAMELVRRALPAARLRVVGDGPELPRLRTLVESLDLSETVDLLGSVHGISELQAELGRAHVFCLPSRQEGFGIVFLEAMAAGLPIVAADCGAVPETAPHGEVSLLVDPDDVEGLASALLRLLGDEKLREMMVASGARRWRRFAWTRVAEQFLAEIRGK
jgi:glycosyltransferase involved in cell wall biosynthesis